ncbi:aldo/keto reductase [Pleionea sp. CnH1-48]|uniref:aldo/keto reductase n=1 Tax=Pleionea sp. CnH1-48 TaxID=2954494 RepID=UPI0020976A83|nr:aldo/keto reductase [Pleionea sp. CnH1-48]MCO7223784.1 aldo/keto reductase [Pleionea sp. CnH1-48]
MSRIALGTMRFAEKSMRAKEVSSLIEYCLKAGVTSLHASHEYESYQLFCSALSQLSQADRAKIDSIVKVSGPHFDESTFCKSTFEYRIDQFLKETGLEHIDVCQWMWRLNPLDDDLRIERYDSQSQQIEECFAELKQSGKVKSFMCFPYSARFMRHVIPNSQLDGHINYLNFWESDAVDVEEMSTVVLRPLGAGKVSSITASDLNELEKSVGVYDRSPLFHSFALSLSAPFVKNIVVSMSTTAQVDDILSIEESVVPSESLHMKYKAFAGAFKS